jgi:NAD(P)-dependent dehydrogenase (short-subunit alcohol dehydrogenase family)
MKILVIGGTGNVGGVLVKELLKRKANVRVLARKQPEEGGLPAAVEVAIGDLLDPVSVEQAMQGVDKLFLLNGVAANELTQALIAYGIARRAGLKHGHNFDEWEQQMRARAPGWAAFDLRTMFQCYFDRGFASTEQEVARVTKLFGHAPHSYEDFASETATIWRNE